MALVTDGEIKFLKTPVSELGDQFCLWSPFFTRLVRSEMIISSNQIPEKTEDLFVNNYHVSHFSKNSFLTTLFLETIRVIN